MQGKILNFDVINDTGIISDVNGRRYNFSSKDWKDSMKFPKEGLLVSFEQSGRDANKIYVIEQSIKVLSRKELTLKKSNKLMAFCLLLGLSVAISFLKSHHETKVVTSSSPEINQSVIPSPTESPSPVISKNLRLNPKLNAIAQKIADYNQENINRVLNQEENVKSLLKEFEENKESDGEPDTERQYLSLISNLMTEFTEASENDDFNEYNQSSDDTIENRTISKNKIINCTKALINIQKDYEYRNNTLIREIMQKIIVLSQSGKTFPNGDTFEIIEVNSPEFINEKNSELSQNRKESINHQTDLIKNCELTISVSQEKSINSVNEPITKPTTDFKTFGLIPSENLNEHQKQIIDGRTNPFSLIPIEPSKIPAKTPSPKIKKYLTYSKGDFETENIFLSIMLKESVDLDRSPELIGKIRNSDLEQFSEGRSMLEDTLNKSYVACDEYMKERNETHKTYLELLNDLPSEESKKSAEIIINNLCPSLK